MRGRWIVVVLCAITALSCSRKSRNAKSPDQPDAAALHDEVTVEPLSWKETSAPCCNADGFCWVLPRPQGLNLRSVWMASADELWATGERGTILHWKAGQWSCVNTGRHETLGPIQGHGQHVMISARPGFLRWDGSRWSALRLGKGIARESFQMVGPDDFWVDGWHYVNGRGTRKVAYYGEILHFGSSPDDVWIVGERHFLHYEKSKGDFVETPVPEGFSGRLAFARAPDDAWAASGIDDSTLIHWDGSSWKVVPYPGTRIEGLSDGWATIDEGSMRWDGSQWKGVPDHTFGQAGANAIWSSAGNVASVGYGGQVHLWKNDEWFAITDEYPRYTALVASAGTLRAFGFRGAFLWDGSAMKKVEFPVDLAFRDAHASGKDEGWGVQGNWAARWKGGKVSAGEVPEAGSLEWVWGTSDGAWATSGEAELFRNSGGKWARFGAAPIKGIQAIHGTAMDDVWIVGKADAVAHWDGKLWQVVTVPGGQKPTELNDVFAVSRSDVWIVGDHSVLRFDGTSWSRSEKDGRHNRLWAASGDEVWIADHGGPVHRWDGKQWTEMDGGFAYPRDLVGDDQSIWISDGHGLIRKLRQ